MTTKVREQRTRHNQSQRAENTTQPKSGSREHDTTKVREQRSLHNQSQRAENTTRQKKELVSVERVGQALDDLPSKDEKSRPIFNQTNAGTVSKATRLGNF